MQTEFQLKRPIDGITLDIIRAIHDATTALGHRAMLVGATARIILIEHVFGLQTGRATKDVDFAFAMDTWEQFDTLKQHLVDVHGFSADDRVLQKLYYRADGAAYGIPVDLVPFGALGGEREEIAWPPEMAVVMNVAGFADALKSAVEVEIAPGIRIAIASLPAIAVLKLFAWLDRRRETPKDAGDLTALLHLYFEIDPERVYTIPEVLESVGYDIELGGAWLLGNDARKVALAATTEKLSALLADAVLTDDLVRDMARELRTQHDPEGHAAVLLRQFRLGFEAD